MIRLASEHPAQLILIASGGAYLYGYVNVRLFVAGLGVSPTDVNLTTNDYLITALVWLVLVSAFVAGYVLVQSLASQVGWRSLTGLFIVGGAVLAAVVSVLAVGMATSTRWLILLLLVVGSVAGAAWWFGGPGLALVILVLLAFAPFFACGSYDYGRGLGDAPMSVGSPPLHLAIVIAVEEGTAELADGTECVRRVADRVYVTSEGVRVEPDPVPFQPGPCFAAS